jgi:hypothetical protein
MELQQAVAHLDDKAAICAELSRLTGHALAPTAAPRARTAPASASATPIAAVSEDRLAHRL